jgi:hypothetical protein
METGLAVSFRARLSFVILGSLVALLAGCAGDYRGPGDPLFGGYTPHPGQAAALPAGPLPPLPAPSSTASNAALASIPFRPVDGAHDLRIGSPGNAPAIPVAGPQSNPQAEFTPVGPSSPRPGLGNSDGSKLTTYDQAQARLSALGVTWQRLETQGTPAEWQFSCSIPNRQNPSIRRTYQAQGHDSLAAIQAVLEQIDREQR